VELADGRGPRGLSLSPATLAALAPGDRIMLPSANGSHCAALAAELGVPAVGGCLRNAGAVAHWLAGRAGTLSPVALIPCGERWPDGSLRPAVEDLIGAGAIAAALLAGHPALRPSPEAQVAAGAFASVAADLHGALAGSVSGRELEASGKGDDIEWAAALDASAAVPVRGDDGAFGLPGEAPTSRPG
jgi:2-phosphosulfolactate phosphatase